MAEAKSKSKTVTCTLCDKPITTGKPVIIDDDPYHSDCAKAMEQSSGATEEAEDDEAEEEDEETEDEDGEDEGDEDEEDEEEDEEPVSKPATKVAAKAPAKSAKRVVVEEEDDEDEDDEDDEEEDDEEEEEVVVRPAAKKAAAPAKKAAPVKAKARVVVEDDDDEDEDDEEEEEEVVVRKPVAKAKAVTKAAVTKRAAADYEEEDEPEARPTKAKSNGVAKKPAAPKVDTSGWGNPAGNGTKRYFVYQALREVSKDELAVADGKGKPENVVTRAQRLQRDWAKETKTTLSEKDKNFTSMNVGWIYNHADELGLVMRRNEEAGTYRILKAKAADSD
jgi:hypothetical protein